MKITLTGDYIRTSHPLIQRIKAIWNILTKRNFILLYDINARVEGDKVKISFESCSRTDYGTYIDAEVAGIYSKGLKQKLTKNN